MGKSYKVRVDNTYPSLGHISPYSACHLSDPDVLTKRESKLDKNKV